jgi:hypothetical protein
MPRRKALDVHAAAPARETEGVMEPIARHCDMLPAQAVKRRGRTEDITESHRLPRPPGHRLRDRPAVGVNGGLHYQ